MSLTTRNGNIQDYKYNRFVYKIKLEFLKFISSKLHAIYESYAKIGITTNIITGSMSHLRICGPGSKYEFQ